MKALLIDDSSATRFILGKMLKELGISYVEAADGAQALSVLEREQGIQFCLVDWNMPVMNGLEFVQKTRARKEFDEIKLMMVTTEVEMTKVIQALEAGANEYVMKPFTKEMIEEKLKLLGWM